MGQRADGNGGRVRDGRSCRLQVRLSVCRVLGLVPHHKGTGGWVRLLGISKRGDKYLRIILIHGARTVLSRAKAPPDSAARVTARPLLNVAFVASVNKTARTIWALFSYNQVYKTSFSSQPARGSGSWLSESQTNKGGAPERLRKARQGVMVKKSNRDPTSLHLWKSWKLARGNEARVDRFRTKT